MDTDTIQRLTHLLVGSVCTEVSLEAAHHSLRDTWLNDRMRLATYPGRRDMCW